MFTFWHYFRYSIDITVPSITLKQFQIIILFNPWNAGTFYNSKNIIILFRYLLLELYHACPSFVNLSGGRFGDQGPSTSLVRTHICKIPIFRRI